MFSDFDSWIRLLSFQKELQKQSTIKEKEKLSSDNLFSFERDLILYDNNGDSDIYSSAMQ